MRKYEFVVCAVVWTIVHPTKNRNTNDLISVLSNTSQVVASSIGLNFYDRYGCCAFKA